MEVVLGPSFLNLNYFKSLPTFLVVDFEQINICWENYLTFYMCDICFNVSIGGRQNLTRSNARNSVIFLISHTQCDVTFANVDFEQVNICWENYLTFYMCDICFNVSIGERQNLTRSNARNSVVFLISHTQCDVTFTSLQLIK